MSVKDILEGRKSESALDGAPDSRGLGKDVIDEVDGIDKHPASPTKGDLEFEKTQLMGRATKVSFVRSIEVEAVVGGCHQRITLEGVSPAEVKAYLLSLDANAQVRGEFPAKFNSGPKEIKTGLLNSLTVKGGKYVSVEMVVVGEDGAGIAVVVSKKKIESFLPEFEKIAPGDKVESVRELLGAKEGSETFLSMQLGGGKPVTVKYSQFEGRSFFEGFEVVEADK